MDALDLLAMQHRDARALFSRIARSRSARARRVNTGRLGDLLAVHQITCEHHLMPVLGEAAARDGLREVVEELTHVDVGDSHFQARLRSLRERVERHAGDEERRLFARARQLLDGEARERIGRAMADEAERMGRLRPRFDMTRPPKERAPSPTLRSLVALPIRFALRLPDRIYRLARLLLDGRRD